MEIPSPVRDLCQQQSSGVRYATEDLKADRALMMKAVALNGMALQYASEDLHRLSGPISRDTAILSLRFPISRDTFSGRLGLPQKMVRYTPLGT